LITEEQLDEIEKYLSEIPLSDKTFPEIWIPQMIRELRILRKELAEIKDEAYRLGIEKSLLD
jgi:hypothetical protein